MTIDNNTAERNATSFSNTLLGIIDSKDKSDSGAFTLISKHDEDVRTLFKRVDAARNVKDASVRGVLLDFFSMDPKAERLMNRYSTLVDLKAGVSAIQRLEKQQIKRKLNAVVTNLTRLVDVQAAIMKIEAQGFTVEFRGVPNSAATVCRIKGRKDDDYAPFSVSQVMRLCDKDLANTESYAQLQEIGKTKAAPRAAGATAPAGSAENIGANLSRISEGVADAIAGLSFEKDGGISPAARVNLAHLWAVLDEMMTDEQKEKAREAYAADADKTEDGASETAAA